MEQHVISVIIPFYNEELFLKRAINSVLIQTYSAIQIILVDDGSTDKSTVYAKEFCENYPNCKMVIISNSGPGNARNIGIENATGSYIAFLDADDIYQPTSIEVLYKNITDNNADVSVGQYIMLDKNENILKITHWDTSLSFDNKTAISYVVSEKLIPTSWGKLFKTKIAKECSFPNLSWKEDDIFFLIYLLKSNTVSVVNKTLLTVNCRPNSLTRQIISKKMIENICKSYRIQFEILKPLNDTTINRSLIKSEVNTLLNLLILLKIDWNKIEKKEMLWIYYTEKISALSKRIKRYKLTLKKRMLLSFLISTTTLGWRYAFLTLSVFKSRQINHLEKVKS